ncbi:MAG: ABC transporter ATP-binding protein [Thiovulaceae bacterium]|nr:ABC transporter ATP-binding protein [Sulfurimonadaceae bacterium]
MHIKIDHLHCSYEKNQIINDLCLEIKSQGHLTVLGANGSGKSTFAKAMSGLLTFEGKISFNQQNIATLSTNDKAKSIAYIPSKLESFDSFTTVEDFVLMGRFPHKEPFRDYSDKDYEKVADILEELSLTHLASNSLHQLSSGQQQLTLIAQALAQESQIIIFDEPTSNLDPKNALFFSKLLKSLQTTHTTILITHDLNLAFHIKGSLLFLARQKNHYFESSNEFFTQENLSKLYQAPFTLQTRSPGLAYE